MSRYILRRVFFSFVIILLASFAAFIVIQLPPGDFLSVYVHNLQSMGVEISQEEIDGLNRVYGLDQPFIIQYGKWISRFLRGDMGYSFNFQQPVNAIIKSRLPITLLLTCSSALFTYLLAIPIGIYSATHKYSPGDYLFTFLGFIGLAIPNFLIALLLMWLFYNAFGLSIGGLFSPEFENALWGFSKFYDLMKHLIVPVVVIGTSGTAGMIRIMRSSLLDELKKPYVIASRSRGNKEFKLIMQYPVRMSLLPIVSGLAWLFPRLISGATIVSVVLNLPTIGATLYQALTSQDMYLAGSCLLLMTFLTVIGMFISDLLLAMVDPRIHFN